MENWQNAADRLTHKFVTKIHFVFVYFTSSSISNINVALSTVLQDACKLER